MVLNTLNSSKLQFLIPNQGSKNISWNHLLLISKLSNYSSNIFCLFQNVLNSWILNELAMSNILVQYRNGAYLNNNSVDTDCHFGHFTCPEVLPCCICATTFLPLREVAEEVSSQVFFLREIFSLFLIHSVIETFFPIPFSGNHFTVLGRLIYTFNFWCY